MVYATSVKLSISKNPYSLRDPVCPVQMIQSHSEGQEKKRIERFNTECV